MPSFRRFSLRIDSTLRRRLLLGLSTLLLLGISVTILIIVVIWSSSKDDDRLAVIANWLAAGTLALALLAALVALRAYAVATGVPDLKLYFKTVSGHPNEPRFIIGEQDAGRIRTVPVGQPTAIRVRNNSLYAARTPAVVVCLQGMAVDQRYYAAAEQWTITERSETGDITEVQWDGGPNYSIHGQFKRILPNLYLNGLYRFSAAKTAKFAVSLVADGYTPHVVELDATFSSEETRPGSCNTPEWL